MNKMTDIIEDNDDICEHEYHAAFLERTLQNMFTGMEALEEICDRLRAENRQLKNIIEMGAKKVH